LSSIAR